MSKVILKLITIRDTFLVYFRYLIIYVRCTIGKLRHEKSIERDLLILAWLFPPVVSGGVYRPLSFARYAAENGWRVTVIAGPEPEIKTEAGQYLYEQLSPNVRVVRIKQSKLSLSYQYIPNLDGQFVNVIQTLKTVLSLEEIAPSIILASGPPFHNFVVGWYLSHYFNAPLVLDYRDEWTQCPFDFVRAGDFDIDWEQRCLSRARSVIVTTQSFAEHAMRSFPKINTSKFQLIPNGFDTADLPEFKIKMEKIKDEAIIEIAFLGHLDSHTPPHEFVSTLKDTLSIRPEWAKRLKLKFVGTRSADMQFKLKQSGLSHLIEFIDQVPKPEAINIMQKSTVLLIFNPIDLQRYIPGKLFDYIASGTPVLVYGESGEVADIVSKLRVGEVVPENDPCALAFAIEKIVRADEVTDNSERDAWLALHDRGYIANKLITHLDNILING